MILSRLDLIAYGRFTGVSLDLSAGPRRFHLIYGPNESGKSTSLRAITSLLFGMPHAADDCFLHNSSQLRVGGQLVDALSGDTLECVRRRGRKGTLRDHDDLKAVDESVLQSMIGGMDRATFLSRFGLSYQALVEGGAAILEGSGDLGQILFAAGAGLGRLREIQTSLEQEAAELYLPRGSKSRINLTLKQLDDDRRARDQAIVASAEYDSLQEKLNMKQREADTLGWNLRECMSRLARLKNMQQALPLLPEWISANDAFARVADVPDLDDEFIERRRKASIDSELASRRLEALQSTIDQLTLRLSSHSADPIVLKYGQEIEAAFQEIAALRQADQERSELLRDQRTLDREITRLLQQLIQPTEHIATPESERDIDPGSVMSTSLQRPSISDPTRAAIHDLAARHAGLASRRDDAKERLAASQLRLADLVMELENLGPIPDPMMLGHAIESIGNPEPDQQAFIECQQNCEALQQLCQSLLQRLDGFDGGLDGAIALRLPDEQSMNTLADSRREWMQSLDGLEQSRKSLQQDRDATQSQLDDLQSEGKLPTKEELHERRTHRDTVFDELINFESDSRGLRTKAHELRQRIDAADRVADAICEHAQRIHQRVTLSSQLRRLDDRIRTIEPSILHARSMLDSLHEQWNRLWESCHVRPGSVEQMQRWRAHHTTLCQRVEQWRSEEKKLEQIRARIERGKRKLRHAIDHAASFGTVASMTSRFEHDSSNEPVEQDLCEMFERAIALRSQWTQDALDRRELQQRRQQLADEMPALETRFQAAEYAIVQWHQDWERLTKPFLASNHTGITEVLEVLDQIRQLESLHQRRDAVVEKLLSLDEKQHVFGTQVARLAGDVHQPHMSHSSPLSVAKAMYERLQSERQSAQHRKALEDQIESSQQQKLDAIQARGESQIVLDQLCKEAKCRTADELPEIERLARERRTLQSVLSDLRNQLLLLAADRPLEVFLDDVSRQPAEMIQADIQRETQSEVELKRQLEIAHQEVGATQNELRRVDGGSQASDLSQDVQMKVGSLRCDAEEYARLRIGALILQRAIDHYRQENQSPVLALANHYFRQLTCGVYFELRPDYDADGVITLYGIPRSGEPVPAAGMSTGTADALYLALRLASMQHQMQDGRTVPVVIDDCLIQLDDARAVAALQAFSELSERTQVILFTHHEHLCQLAAKHLESHQFHLHRLDQASMLF